MNGSSVLSKVPVLRLLIPLIAGILFFNIVHSLWLPGCMLLCAAVMLVIMHYRGKLPMQRMRLRRYRILPLSLVMMAVGCLCTMAVAPEQLDVRSLDGQVACARIEKIEFNEKSMSMELKLIKTICNDGDELKIHDSHIIFSTRGCNYEFKAGDLIAFTLELEPIKNLGNPDEMDYAKYLYRKGFLYSQHVDVNEVEKIGESPTFLTRAFNARQHLQHKVINSGMSQRSQAVIIAMLLGNDDFIGSDVRDEFSRAGVSHVLALSGLHVGIITLIIWFLLFPLDYFGGKRYRLLLTLALLIGYDLLTGMSPSAVRATVMIAFVFSSVVFLRKSTPLNSLAAAALVILIFSPNSLYSVGFQLSFIIVAALILFYEMFELKMTGNKLLNYLYTTFLTSLVAMLSSIVLTAYYFNTVSLVSVFSNVLLMPLVPVFMVVGTFALTLLIIGGELSLLNNVIDWVTSVIDGAVGWFASSPLSSSNVYVTQTTVVIYYVVLALLISWLYWRNFRFALVAGVVVILGLAISLIDDLAVSRRGMVIFNSYNSTPVLYYNNGKAMLWVPDVQTDFDIEGFKRRHRAFLSHHKIDSILLIDSIQSGLNGCVIQPPYAKMCGRGFVAVGKGRWKHRERVDSTNMRFDYVIVTKQFHSQVSELQRLMDFDSLMFSGAIYRDDLPMFIEECKQLKIPYRSIKSEGAFVIRE